MEEEENKMADNKSVGSYENDYNHKVMPPMGKNQPAYQGSQSSTPNDANQPVDLNRKHGGDISPEDEQRIRNQFMMR